MTRYAVTVQFEADGGAIAVNYVAAPSAREAELALFDLYTADDMVVEDVKAQEIESFPASAVIVNAMS